MSEAEFLEKRSVSRETLERLRLYDALLRKWNPAINLVAKSTLDHVWRRHFLDSAQLFDLAGPSWRHWADLGSGGGFPGLVVAILAADEMPQVRVSLVESDHRKAAFLSAVIRETGIAATVVAERIEMAAPQNTDIVSARALAPLDRLLTFAERHMAAKGIALLPKGAAHAAELRQALDSWRFSYHATNSETDPDAVIYLIKDISRA